MPVTRTLHDKNSNKLTRSQMAEKRGLKRILKNMLFLIGLGLADEKDITVRGLEAVRRSERVYLEAYTSILLVEKERLEAFYERPVIVADREMVEMAADDILRDANECDVSFLVVGDPFGATTHSDLIIRARELGIPVKVIHNASVMNAIGCCGLQLYNFGQTVSVVFFTDTWRPDSFYDKIKSNMDQGLHTLCLLDIKVKEQSIENLARGRKIFEPPRYLTINQTIDQLLEVEQNRQGGIYAGTTIGVGIARLGSDTQQIVTGTFEELANVDFGAPLHCFIVPAKMHFLEADFLREYAVDAQTFDQFARISEC